MGLVKEIQKVFLDDADFLRDIVKKNLQELLQSEFDELYFGSQTILNI
jgi:hypothetical protein